MPQIRARFPHWKRSSENSAQLLRRYSRWNLGLKIVGVLLFLVMAWGLRYWALEGVRVPDSSLHPAFKKGTWVWICKLPTCLDHAQAGDLLLFETTTGQRLLRQIAAQAGEDLTGEQNGRITGTNFRRILREDSWFLIKQSISTPRRGDTLHFATMRPAQFDLATRLFKEQNSRQKFHIKPSLWLDDRPAPLVKAQSAEIHGIPIRLKDLGSMSWQELHLIEMQVLRNELGTSRVSFQREVWNDSARIDSFIAQEDCFFTLCLRGRDCVDSRELGFIPRNRAIGVQFSAGFLAIFRSWIFPTGETKSTRSTPN